MVRQITVTTLCDACYQEDIHTEGHTTKPITIGNLAKARTLELCDRHEKEILQPLTTLLHAAGAKVDDDAIPQPRTGSQAGRRKPLGNKSLPGPFDCLIPDCTSYMSKRNGGKGYKNLGSLMSHTRNHHGIPYRQYVQEYGEPVRLTDDQAQTLDIPTPAEQTSGQEESGQGEIPAEFVCGIDGCTKTYPPEKYNRPAQALGIHRAQEHGVRGMYSKSPRNKDNVA